MGVVKVVVAAAAPNPIIAADEQIGSDFHSQRGSLCSVDLLPVPLVQFVVLTVDNEN